MPSQYGDKTKKDKKKKGGKRPSTMKPMTDAQHKKFEKAVKDGIITKG